MKTLILLLNQTRYENKIFWRNPPAAFFTFVFPLMFLVIFNVIFGDDEFETGGETITASAFYVPAIIALSVVSACYTNIAMNMSFARDRGLIKRITGTPLPTWIFVSAKTLHACLIGMLLVGIIILTGSLFYSVSVPTSTLPALMTTLVLGCATFCTLGIAITALIPNADAAPAIVNGSALPLLFISDVFIPMTQAPGWVTWLARIFPIKPFSTALHTAFRSSGYDSGFEINSLIVLTIWLAIGLIIASKFFPSSPRV
jgi:ABC-2 type transport system permease protein